MLDNSLDYITKPGFDGIQREGDMLLLVPMITKHLFDKGPKKQETLNENTDILMTDLFADSKYKSILYVSWDSHNLLGIASILIARNGNIQKLTNWGWKIVTYLQLQFCTCYFFSQRRLSEDY